jgi:uncharacterized protein
MMKSVGWQDFLIGVGIMLMLEGILFSALPGWMRGALKRAMEAPDHLLRIVGLVSAVAGLFLIWLVR